MLWFAEMEERKLYLHLGYSSIHQYANEALGFSSNKTYRFLRLTADLKRLPRLRESVATGALGWTKAREVAKVASIATEERWIAAAKKTSRRMLEQKVLVARQRAAAKRKANPMQGRLGADVAPTAPGKGVGNRTGRIGPVVDGFRPDEHVAGALAAAQLVTDEFMADELGTDEVGADELKADEIGPDELVADGPTSVVLRFAPTELARYEALVEKLYKSRKVNPGATREEVMLSALDVMVGSATEALSGVGDSTSDERAERPEEDHQTKNESGAEGVSGGLDTGETAPSAKVRPRGNSRSNYRIVVCQCAACHRASVKTDRGPKQIGTAELDAIRCDAVIAENGRRTRSVIPPSVRGRVLARDRHRCQAPGCARTRFLEVHHIRPGAWGGSNRPENLTTLCSGCHRLRHSRTHLHANVRAN
ncbi:HNH endonuclease [Candidatus Eisenbacteria bacterium]|uniref:HNH endonuclease n=1 Tax=Eiseniibacteriota bacterium TaxID=2212470 RepID=A0ABV6YK79_UNCEI